MLEVQVPQCFFDLFRSLSTIFFIFQILKSTTNTTSIKQKKCIFLEELKDLVLTVWFYAWIFNLSVDEICTVHRHYRILKIIPNHHSVHKYKIRSFLFFVNLNKLTNDVQSRHRVRCILHKIIMYRKNPDTKFAVIIVKLILRKIFLKFSNLFVIFFWKINQKIKRMYTCNQNTV